MALSTLSKAHRTIGIETKQIENLTHLLTNPFQNGSYQCATPERRAYLEKSLQGSKKRLEAARAVVDAS